MSGLILLFGGTLLSFWICQSWCSVMGGHLIQPGQQSQGGMVWDGHVIQAEPTKVFSWDFYTDDSKAAGPCKQLP